ncbi:type II toxin-antitoxin system VapC family toxin [Pseudoduganella sp. LjRoot289]|uniref:type II toxin-antitoxin system VapC family toxin n=1 Tax=Pseudoduganella sp. LjRoot289 TaxID=3342314 RepID=UPI003ECC8293
MTRGFILDASVSMRWVLFDGTVSDRAYADSILEAMVENRATVPSLWYTESTQVLRCAEDCGQLTAATSDAFMRQIRRMPIDVDTVRPQSSQQAVAAASRKFRISAYDAQYLELASRLKLPIATLDMAMRKAASKAGVAIYRP